MPLFSDRPLGKVNSALPSTGRKGLFADRPLSPYEDPVVNERTARPPTPKSKSKPGFLEGIARANLGLVESGVGSLAEYLPETLSEGLANTAGVVGEAFGMPKGLPAAIVRSQTERLVTPENAAAYRQAVRPITQPLVQEGQRQQQLAGPGRFTAPSQQKSFSLGETAGYMGEQALRNIAPVAAGFTVGALTRSPAAAEAVMGGLGYGATLDEVLNNQKQQGFQDVNRAVDASLASAALDVLTGGEAKVAQAATKEVRQKLFREGAKDLSKDLLKIGAEEAGTEAIQTGFERYGANKDLFSKDAIGDYIDSAAAGFGGGVVMGGGVRLLTGGKKQQETKTTEEAGTSLLGKVPEEQAAPPPKTPSFVETDADNNAVVNMDAVRANPKMALDELSDLYSRDNIITSLAGDAEADDYTTSLGARLHRAINSGNPKSIPNLARSLKRDIDADIHGDEAAAQRAPLVSKAALMLGDYVALRKEAMSADERATNPALIAEQAAANNAQEVARIQAAKQQQQDELNAEQARAEAERKAQLDATARQVEAIHRKGILEQVSKDPATRDPVARFQALLKRNGFNPELTAEEQKALTEASVNAEARLAGEAAKMDMSVAEYKQMLAEDEARQRLAESGTASMEARIPEAGAKQPTPAKPKAPEMAPGKTNRAAPENFQLEMQRELTDADIEAQQKAAARRQAKEDRALAKANERAERRAAKAQGELFTPTGRPTKAAAQAPKVTVSQQLKEKANAAKEGQQPKGRVAERVGANEKRQAAEASRRNRPERSTEKRQEVAKVEEKVTHEQVAERANDARQNGYINEPTRQRIALLAEQKNVPAETLNKMLDQAVERGTQEKLAVKPGQKPARATRTERGKLADALKKELQRLGLNKVGLGVVNDLTNIFEKGIAAGRYMPGWGMIDVVYADMKQAMETLHHEVIHYLRDANIFTDAEWDTLSATALADKKLMARIDRDWPTLNNEEKVEEAIAEMFREWMSTQRAQPGLRGVFQKIKNLITALRRGFNKPEFAAVKEIFSQIDEGKRGDENVTTLRGDPTGAVKLKIEENLDRQNVPSQVGRQTGFLVEKYNSFYDKFARKDFTWSVVQSAIDAGLTDAGVYQDIMLDRQKIVSQIEQKFSKALEKFDALPDSLKRVSGDVNTLLRDSVLGKEWAFAPTWLKEGTYKINPQLEEKFNSLPKDAQEFIKSVFKTNLETLEFLKKTVDEALDEPYDRLIQEAKDAGNQGQAAQLQREREGARARLTSLFKIDPTVPYASLRRHGDYIVVAKSAEFAQAERDKDTAKIKELESNPEHYFFNKYSTADEAKAKREKLLELGLYSEKETYAMPDVNALDTMAGGKEIFNAFNRIFNSLESGTGATEGLTDATRRMLQSMVIDMQVMSMSNSAARKSEINSRRIWGDDIDMVRNFALQGKAMAHRIASLKNNDMLMESIQGMKSQIRESADPMEAGKFYKELMLRHIGKMDYSVQPAVQAVKRFGAMWNIMLAPMFYIQNALTVPLFTGPQIAGRFGTSKTKEALWNALKDVSKTWKDTKWSESLKVEALPEDVRDVVQRLVDMGLVDVGLNSDLGSVELARGAAEERFGLKGRALDATTEKFGKLTDTVQDLTRKQESIMRSTAGIAAYRLMLQQTGSRQKSLDYAAQIIRETMGTYDGFNEPRYMKGLAGIPFQFRKFQLMQLGLLLRHVKNGLTDTSISAEERFVAQKMIGYHLSTAAMTAGLRGLPGVTALSWAASALSALFSDSEPPEDWEQKLRKFVGDKDIADILIYGAPAMVDIDLSSSAGFGNVISVLPYTKLELSKQGVKNATFDLLGAAPSSVGKIADGIQEMSEAFKRGDADYYRGLEKMLPRGVGSAIQAYREAQKGISSPKGVSLLKPEDVSTLDTIKTILGVRSVETSERQRKQNVEIALDGFFKDKTSVLKSRFANAVTSGDDKEAAKVREEWLKMQDVREKAGKPRQPISTLFRAVSEKRSEDILVVGGVQYRDKDARWRAAVAGEDEEDSDEE